MPDEMGAPPQIDAVSIDDYLDVMSKAVFQSGISWRVIEAKWPSTREAFHGFDAKRVASMSEREIDALVQDTRVIRNRRKLEAVVGNAARMLELDAQHGSFKAYLRSAPDFEETVQSLRKNFKFMGEMGCYYFLWVVKEPVPPYHEWAEARNRPAPPARSRPALAEGAPRGRRR
ncbi:MAG: DNA-3-methyladenine glycosylase I [Dehalococcoidia bacterium]